MFSLRPLLIAPLVACALAGPAVAATKPVYDVDIATKLSGTASGTDNDGWTSKSKFSTNIGQTYRGPSSMPGTSVQSWPTTSSPRRPS